MNCHIDCACTGLLSAGVMNTSVDILPPELISLIDNLGNSGANINVDALFTLFWDDNQGDDLDMWVSFNNINDITYMIGYRSGGGKSGYKSFNEMLGAGLDVDAWASGKRPRHGHSIENIGMIDSSTAPDGVYGAYVDNYSNYTGRNTPFNFTVLYKSEVGGEFNRVLWLRGIMPKDKPTGDGDITKMLHVLDLKKSGRAFSLENVTAALETVYQYEFGSL